MAKTRFLQLLSFGLVLMYSIGAMAKTLPFSDDRAMREGERYMKRHQYTFAIEKFESIARNAPLSRHVESALIHLMYAQFKQEQFDEAQNTAEHIMYLFPRSKHADYVLFMQGNIQYQRAQYALRQFFGVRPEQNIDTLKGAFTSFAQLASNFPKSPYTGLAIHRMKVIRNLLADRSLAIAKYYAHQGATVAAISRLQSIIADYPGAPATHQALKVLVRCYHTLGLDSWAHVVEKEQQRLKLK